MKYFLVAAFCLFGLTTKAELPSSSEFVKYLGYSKYQIEFQEIYKELSKTLEKIPNVASYGEPAYGYFFKHDDAKLYFDDNDMFYRLGFNNLMPFKFKKGMKENAVHNVLRKLGVEKEESGITDEFTFSLTKETEDGYILRLEFWDQKLSELYVVAGYNLSIKRAKGGCEHDGLKFPNAESLSNYLNNVPYKFAYLTTENGTCLRGNCKDGKGEMVWENKKAFYKAVSFTGNFVKGEPKSGEVVFSDEDLGEVKLRQIQVRDGFLQGISVIEYETGDTARIEYNNGSPVWSSGLRFLDGKIISGTIKYEPYSYKPEIDKNETVITYKDGTIYKVKAGNFGKISGQINYPSGFRYVGDLTKDLARTYGALYDPIRGGSFFGDFSNSSIRDAYWKYPDGTYRKGAFSTDYGFLGSVTTNYQNQVSLYSVTGEFVNNKKEGEHVLYAHEQKKTLGKGTYKNDILIAGVDVYKDPVKGLLGAKAQEKGKYLEFQHEYERVVQLYKDKGYRVEGVVFNDVFKSFEFNNQNDRVLSFIVYDPFSGSSSYTVNTEGSGGYSLESTAYNYPAIHLNPVKGSPHTYTNKQTISTLSKTTLFCRLKQGNPKNKKYKAALVLISK